MSNNYSPRYNYNESQINEPSIIREKLADHASILAKIILGKRSVYGTHAAEDALLAALRPFTQITGSMKIESESMMSEKIAARAETVARMLMVLKSDMTFDGRYTHTASEATLWAVVGPMLVGKNGYTPR